MRIFFILIIILTGAIVQISAQTATGRIIDSDSGHPLGGATILQQGTSNGEVTDQGGSFSLTLDKVPAILKVSYIGYRSQSVAISPDDDLDLGMIRMKPAAMGLEEVVVTGIMDIVQDRRTPVAVSSIGASELQAKASGNVLLPEVAKSTPSVYVASQAGGYGEGEVFTRGFDQTNTAFLLNGQPVNGMDDGKIYWVNWSGLADVASAIQIQRGLGASKLAISSVGGTWNFVMKATDMERGGTVLATIGNNNYNKTGASYSTGMVNDKWGMSVLFARWSGNGWAHGTPGEGQTYFISGGYKPASRHKINLLLTGAPQKHDQNFGNSIRNHFDAKGKLDPKYNNNWGVYNGKYLSERTNYYHKPVINLNWDWEIDDRSAFSTVLYGSLGRGGGTGGLGGEKIRTSSGLIDFDATAADTSTQYFLRTSVNNHNWFGGVLKYEREVTDEINFSAGTDLRQYYGDHFRQVNQLLGQEGYWQFGTPVYPDGYLAQKEYRADAWAATTRYAPRGDRIGYNSAETIRYGGVFAQMEYAKNDFSGYIQGALSSQDHVRHELLFETKENQDSEKVANKGYNAKAGMSYSLSDDHLFFAKAGKYSRQPFHTTIFSGNSNEPNEQTQNEDIRGLEVGYKWTAPRMTANVNLYRTAWNDRVELNPLEVQEDGTVRLTSNEIYEARGQELYELLFQNQLHSGIEVDFKWRMNEHLNWKGFASLGRWEVIGKRDIELYDGVSSLDLVKKYSIAGDDVKVGGAPHTSWGLGVEWNIIPQLVLDADYYYYDKLYARNGGIPLPAYGLVDLNVTYAIPLADGKVIRLTGNVYNLFGKVYVSQAFSSIGASDVDNENWNGVHLDNSVIFGKTRTANFTLKYSF